MEDLSKLVRALQNIVWDSAKCKSVEEAGIKISPCNYYSNIPSINEIETSYEYSPGSENVPPYAASGVFSDTELPRKFLEELAIYSEEFAPFDGGSEECLDGFFWKNSQFSFSDAMAYYALLRHVKPRNVVEIGSGFSTLVAVEAVEKNACGSVTCIEPFPRKFLEQMEQVELIKSRAQDIDSEWLNSKLSDGDVFFIDSTHTVKTGSDCLHIYLRLLPEVKRDIYVHVHDIFLPFGMPESWLMDQHIYWTEQYLLLAFLLDNPKAKFLYGSHFHKWSNPGLLEKFMHGRARSGGGSFWFKYSGSEKSD
jgi:hypothetical protein